MTRPELMDHRLAERLLADTLTDIENHETDYGTTRYALIAEAMSLALFLGFDAGVGADATEPACPVVYIELPTGQVSWHMPAYLGPWDGHTTEVKYERCQAYAAQVANRLDAARKRW